MVLSLGWSGPTKSDGMCDIHAEHLLSIPIIPKSLSQFGMDHVIGFMVEARSPIVVLNV